VPSIIGEATVILVPPAAAAAAAAAVEPMVREPASAGPGPAAAAGAAPSPEPAEPEPAEPEPAEPARPALATDRAPRWIGKAPQWMRYAAGSIIATALSQIALTVAYGLLGATAVVASIVAFFAGTIPNYYLNKAWAWSGQKVSHRRVLVPYLLVIVVTNVAAIAMTLAADSVVRSHIRSDGPRTLLLDLAYVTSNGLMFIVKCLLFDGFLFKPRSRPGAEQA
jgi:putative flippase GtrA